MVKDYPPPKKKVLDHYLHHDLGMPPLLWCFFAHLLILEYPDHHQNLISSSLYYPGPLHKISSQSVHNFLSNVVHRQTDRQTNKQTNATKNITSFAKEVIKVPVTMKCHDSCSQGKTVKSEGFSRSSKRFRSFLFLVITQSAWLEALSS